MIKPQLVKMINLLSKQKAIEMQDELKELNLEISDHIFALIQIPANVFAVLVIASYEAIKEDMRSDTTFEQYKEYALSAIEAAFLSGEIKED